MRTSPRTLIIALAAACLVVPLVAVAQPPAGKLSRIGVLTYLYPPDADPPQAFRHHLRDLGYVEALGLTLSPSILGRADEVIQ